MRYTCRRKLTWLRLLALACWMELETESRDSRLLAPRIGDPEQGHVDTPMSE
jgi:hypothetical protein